MVAYSLSCPPIVENDMDREIVDLTDDAVIVPVLENQRQWAAYALCDLEQPHRQYARYIGAVRAGRVEAVVLAYAPPGFTSLLPSGSADGVGAILATVPNLPPTPLLIARRPDLLAVEARYHVDKKWTMLRMVVAARGLKPAPAVASSVEVRPLTTADLPALQALYAVWPETVFTPFMFACGVYYGALVGGRLAAVAGTLALSARHGIAVIGNVFTRPEYRGRGLGTAVTGAVAHALMARGPRDVVLNVREDNAPAIAAYRRLGFTVHEPFWEGAATLRQGSPDSW